MKRYSTSPSSDWKRRPGPVSPSMLDGRISESPELRVHASIDRNDFNKPGPGRKGSGQGCWKVCSLSLMTVGISYSVEPLSSKSKQSHL